MFIAWLNKLDGKDWPEELMKYLVDAEKRDHEHIPHALTLYQSILDLNAQIVVEIGTKEGKSAKIIVEALKRTGGHLYSVDKCEYKPVDSPFITYVTSDFVKFNIDNPIDVLFDDGSHDYEEVRKALDNFWSSINTPGLYIVADVDSHILAKEAVTDWAEEKNMGFLFDFRGQGAAYFFKPSYPNRYRGVIDSHQMYKWIPREKDDH